MYFIFYESTSFHSDIYFMSCKIVPSALPHSENKWLEMKFFFFKKSDKRKKTKQKEIKNNFPKLTYKDWDFFFFIAALMFRVPEHVDLKNKTKKNLRGFSLFSRDTLKQSLTNKHNSSTKALHMAQSTYII